MIVTKKLPENIDKTFTVVDSKMRPVFKPFRAIYLSLLVMFKTFSEREILYYIFFTVASFLGMFHNNFWFSFMLTEITRRYITSITMKI